jgi:hypothetical protein
MYIIFRIIAASSCKGYSPSKGTYKPSQSHDKRALLTGTLESIGTVQKLRCTWHWTIQDVLSSTCCCSTHTLVTHSIFLGFSAFLMKCCVQTHAWQMRHTFNE